MFESSNQTILKILFSLFAFAWTVSTLVLVDKDTIKNSCGPHIWNYSLGWFVIYAIYVILYLMPVIYNFYTKGDLSILNMLKKYFYVNLFSLIFSLSIFAWGFGVVVGDNCYPGIGLKQIATGNFILTAFHIGLQIAFTWVEFKEGSECMIEDVVEFFRRTFHREDRSTPSSTSSDLSLPPANSGAAIATQPKSAGENEENNKSGVHV